MTTTVKNIFVLFLILVSLNVFAQGDEDPFGELDLDLGEEQTNAPMTLDYTAPGVKKPQKLLDSECLCQCLTKGKRPKNHKSWQGEIIGGKCVCACAK